MNWLGDGTVDRLQANLQVPDLSGTRYRAVRFLAGGGMAAIWLAEDTVLQRRVALKVLDADDSPELASRLLREAHILAALEHPGLVPVHDAGTLPDGRVYYAMKLVRGEPLSSWAAGQPMAERLRAFQKVCEAAAFAHSCGVVHRDLKPGNVMIGSFGEVLVLDWGISRRREDPAEPDGVVVGTRTFMAPEQAAGRTDLVTERTDVYSLGAILDFLLSDGQPRAAKAIASVAARAMSAEPADRYPGAGELAADGRRFLVGGVPASFRETLLERGVQFGGRLRTAIWLVADYQAIPDRLLLFFR